MSVDVDRLARSIWWEREAGFPKFTRRAPDAMDAETGAWARCQEMARQRIHQTTGASRRHVSV